MELGVDSVVGEELGVGAALADPAAVQHDDQIGVAHCRDPVRDLEDRTPREDRAQVFEDVESGETIRTLEGHTSGVRAVAVLDERRVVSASQDHTLRVWDVESGETIRTLEGHTDGVNAVAVLDERRVVSASDDHTLRVWDVESGETMAVFALDAPLSSVAVSADGCGVVAGDGLGGVHFLDLDLSC